MMDLESSLEAFRAYLVERQLETTPLVERLLRQLEALAVREPEIPAGLRRAIEESWHGISESTAFMQVGAPSDLASMHPLALMQLGAAILLDKPIIVTYFEGESLSEHLRRVADRLVLADRDDAHATAEAMQEALGSIPDLDGD